MKMEFTFHGQTHFRIFETFWREKDSAGVSEQKSVFSNPLSPRMLQNEFQNFCDHLTIVTENDGDCIQEL